MKKNASKTLFVYLNVVDAPHPKAKNVESVFIHDEEEARQYVLKTKGFKNVIVFRLIASLDGIYVRIPPAQKMGFMSNVLDDLEKLGFEVGAYSVSADAPVYRVIQMDNYGPRKVNKNIYEVVAPTMNSLKSCQALIEECMGDQ